MTTYLTDPGVDTVGILPGEHARILVRTGDPAVSDGQLLFRPATLEELEALTAGRPKPTSAVLAEYLAARPPLDRGRGSVHDPVMAATRRPFLQPGRRRMPKPPRSGLSARARAVVTGLALLVALEGVVLLAVTW